MELTGIPTSNFLLDGFETENFPCYPEMYLKSISISGTPCDKLGNCIQFGDPLHLATGYLGSISENTDAFYRHYQGCL